MSWHARLIDIHAFALSIKNDGDIRYILPEAAMIIKFHVNIFSLPLYIKLKTKNCLKMFLRPVSAYKSIGHMLRKEPLDSINIYDTFICIRCFLFRLKKKVISTSDSR